MVFFTVQIFFSIILFLTSFRGIVSVDRRVITLKYYIFDQVGPQNRVYTDDLSHEHVIGWSPPILLLIGGRVRTSPGWSLLGFLLWVYLGKTSLWPSAGFIVGIVARRFLWGGLILPSVDSVHWCHWPSISRCVELVTRKCWLRNRAIHKAGLSCTI